MADHPDGVRAAIDRNRLVDSLRFVAIEMVVLTHVLNLRWEFKDLAPWLVRAMMAFNMPLFAFVSGYVLVGREGHSTLKFVRGKALALLVPYFAWIIVELPLREVPLSDWAERLLRAAIDPSAGFQMWFLQVLFVAMTVFALARAVNTSLAFTAAVGAIIAFLPLLPVPHTNLFNRLCWLYPFVVLGYLAGRNREWLRRWDTVAALAGIVLFPLVMMSGWTGVGFRLTAGILGSLALWGIMRHAPETAHGVLGRLGQRTLGVYGWQMVVLPFLIVGSGWPGALTSWALVSVAALLLTLVLEQTTFTRAVFLGRWPRRLGRLG